jgi:hypothetical protein
MGLRRKVMIVSIALVIAGAKSASAFVPDYDIGRHCDRVFGANSTLQGVCAKEEQKAYNHLYNSWGSYESLRGLEHCEKRP